MGLYVRIMKSKKSQAFVWLYILVFIFGIGLLYIILNQPFELFQDKLGGNFTGTQYETTYIQINTLWNLFLVASLLGAIIYGILSTMRKKDDYYG